MPGERGTAVRKAILLLICIMLTGCQAITFSVDGLLNAPNIADEQSAIYAALLESAGRGITLEYPRNGDYRSAFVPYDIDGDGADETLAFYSVSPTTDSNVKISVLDRGEDGSWYSLYELAGSGSSVERILFAGKDVVVGYSSQDYEENTMCIYRYSDGSVYSVHEDSYSYLDKSDFDGDGNEEIAVVKRSGVGVEVEVIKSDDGILYPIELETGSATVAGYAIGDIGGRSAIYLDISPEAGGLLTEVIVLENGSLTNPISQAGLTAATQRPAGYSSRDYDGDGRVEIPTLVPFAGHPDPSRSEVEYMTLLWDFDAESRTLKPESQAYYNISDGYMLTIPGRWLNVVTVLRDRGTGEVTFYRYDPAIGINDSMAPIVSFASADSSGGEAYQNAGYTKLAETDRTSYYVKTQAGADEPLVLTKDEIRDNFHIIE